MWRGQCLELEVNKGDRMKRSIQTLSALAAAAVMALGTAGAVAAKQGADDPAGHQHQGRGADDLKPHAHHRAHRRAHDARHGTDDPAGHQRHGGGADDGANHR
jgi:Ni/Co efflux regulator RcnB